MTKPVYDAEMVRGRLRERGLLEAFDQAVAATDVSRVLELLRRAELPEETVKHVAAVVLTAGSMREE